MTEVKMEWDIGQVMDQIEKMGKDVKKFEQDATLQAANVIKNSVEKNLPRSNVTKAGYTHMKDDVKISALKTDKDYNTFREVRGGSKTNYKWKWLEYGTSTMKGNLFLTKSMRETRNDAIKILNDFIQKSLGL